MIDLLIFIPLIGIIWFILKYWLDMSKTFDEYLAPELSKNGFILISSKYYKPRFMEFPFNDLDEDIKINPLGGKFSIARSHIYRHLRKVVFRRDDGSEHEVIAGIEFVGFSSKKFKRVRWKPDIHTFKANEELTA